METLVASLRSYAKEQVARSQSRILANLANQRKALNVKGGPLVLDVALPGAAYFSVAAGGLAEVLHLLGEEEVQVQRFMGASGGACSLFLILANDTSGSAPDSPCRCPSAELLLRAYLEYGESEGRGAVSRALNALRQTVAGVSNFWERKYREVLQRERAFCSVQSRAFVAVAGKPLRRQGMKMKAKATPVEGDAEEDFEAESDNYLFHDFETVEQAVQAFVATGEATAKGFMGGVHVLKEAQERSFQTVSKRRIRLPASYCDGGHPVVPPQRGDNALLYYCTFFEKVGDALFCTPESVERLFKRGVDRTVDCLCSPELCSPAAMDVADRMVLVPPRTSPCEALRRIGRDRDLGRGAFVGLRARSVVEVGEVV